MSKFSRSVAEDLKDHPALSTLVRSLDLDPDEGAAASSAIGSAVLARLVGVSDASHSATPLADALLLVPYETIPEALADFENLQSSGNDLLDGLFREKRGSAAIEIAREVNLATSAIGRLFPFVAPVTVAGLRSHVRRAGLSAEGLLSWIRAELGERPSIEPQTEQAQSGTGESDTGESTQQAASLNESLAALLPPEKLAHAVPEDQNEFDDSASDVAPSLLVDTGQVGSDAPLDDRSVPESDFDFFGRETEEPTLADMLGELADPKPLSMDGVEDPAPEDLELDDPALIATARSTIDHPFDALQAPAAPSGDPAADLRAESMGEIVAHEESPGRYIDPVEDVDPAMVVPEYREIDHLRDHGEREDTPSERSSFGVSGLAWLWWIAGSVAVILLIALLLALAGSA